jgi:hypothetical protein
MGGAGKEVGGCGEGEGEGEGGMYIERKGKEEDVWRGVK